MVQCKSTAPYGLLHTTACCKVDGPRGCLSSRDRRTTIMERQRSSNMRRFILCFIMSIIINSIIGYMAAFVRCYGSVITTPIFSIYSTLRFDNSASPGSELLGVLLISSVIFMLMLYDIVSYLRYRLGWDKELRQTSLRLGGAMNSMNPLEDFQPPLPMGAKMVIYSFLMFVILLFLMNNWSKLICAVSSASINTK